MIGQFVTLIKAYKGYRNIQIVAREGNRYTAEICGSGAIIEVYDDEFTLDK